MKASDWKNEENFHVEEGENIAQIEPHLQEWWFWEFGITKLIRILFFIQSEVRNYFVAACENKGFMFRVLF